MRIQSLNHSTYQHQYHVVWGTKYRRKYLKPYVATTFRKALEEELALYPTLALLAVSTDEDHVHLQLEIPPNVTVADVVRKLKVATSKEIYKAHPFIRRMYVERSVWSVGYFSSTVGLNEEVVRRYIEHQGKKELPQQVGFEFE